uniref:Uncharacterized protein n=1 Tax=Utricularia reniformis TaxID=192314 RepID=A0A1Y0B0F6_9LAMI|nr:hypothetical protein AEK19_MT0613 [Utricularia reniformis]ART30868.1 hypothetical protein AEK19_MT0613 [Utricularia reniformis]
MSQQLLKFLIHSRIKIPCIYLCTESKKRGLPDGASAFAELGYLYKIMKLPGKMLTWGPIF